MMKARVYLRVAPTTRGWRFAATSKPSGMPLTAAGGTEVLPTIAFGIDLELPPRAFDIPIAGTLVVPELALHAVPAADVVIP